VFLYVTQWLWLGRRRPRQQNFSVGFRSYSSSFTAQLQLKKCFKLKIVPVLFTLQANYSVNFSVVHLSACLVQNPYKALSCSALRGCARQRWLRGPLRGQAGPSGAWTAPHPGSRSPAGSATLPRAPPRRARELGDLGTALLRAAASAGNCSGHVGAFKPCQCSLFPDLKTYSSVTLEMILSNRNLFINFKSLLLPQVSLFSHAYT